MHTKTNKSFIASGEAIQSKRVQSEWCPFDSPQRLYSNVDGRTLYYRLLFTELICLVTFITRSRKTTFSIFVRKTSSLSTTRHSHFLSLFFSPCPLMKRSRTQLKANCRWRRLLQNRLCDNWTGFLRNYRHLVIIDRLLRFLTNFSSEKTFSLVSLSHCQTGNVNTKVN